MLRGFILLLAALPTLASAQVPARAVLGAWFDGAGNDVDLSVRLFPVDPLKPGSRSIDELVGFFGDACLKMSIGTEAARPAIAARPDWGFRFLDIDAGVPSGARLGGWQTADVSLTSQRTAWPLAECNIIAARETDASPGQAFAAIAGILGSQPDKQYRTRFADGLKVQGQSARWSVTGPNGQSRHVYASIFTNRNGVHFIHLGLTEARKE